MRPRRRRSEVRGCRSRPRAQRNWLRRFRGRFRGRFRELDPGAAAVPIGLLALAGFASGSGMRLLDPLLPLVADGLHVTVAGASVLIACFMLPYGLGQAVLGPLGDRLGKLKVVCVAVVLYGLCVTGCAAAPGLSALVWLRAASGAVRGRGDPANDGIPRRCRPLRGTAGDPGPLPDRNGDGANADRPVSGVIGERGGWRMSFVVLGLFAIAVGATLTWRFGRRIWLEADPRGRAAIPGPAVYFRLLARPAGRWLLISAFFDGLCLFGGAFPYVGAFVIQAFGLGAAGAGLVVAGFGLGSFLYTRFARRLVHRFGERGLLLLGGLGIAAGLGGLVVAPNWPVAAASQVFMGLMFYMFHGVLQARATEALPEARGTAVAAFALALFMGQGTGALAFGALLANGGYREGFLAAAMAMTILTLWCRLSMPPQRAPASAVPEGAQERSSGKRVVARFRLASVYDGGGGNMPWQSTNASTSSI